jgi:hypothetical protein
MVISEQQVAISMRREGGGKNGNDEGSREKN